MKEPIYFESRIGYDESEEMIAPNSRIQKCKKCKRAKEVLIDGYCEKCYTKMVT